VGIVFFISISYFGEVNSAFFNCLSRLFLILFWLQNKGVIVFVPDLLFDSQETGGNTMESFLTIARKVWLK